MLKSYKVNNKMSST